MLKKLFVAYVKKALRIGKTFEDIKKMKEHIHHLNVIKNITKYVKKKSRLQKFYYEGQVSKERRTNSPKFFKYSLLMVKKIRS